MKTIKNKKYICLIILAISSATGFLSVGLKTFDNNANGPDKNFLLKSKLSDNNNIDAIQTFDFTSKDIESITYDKPSESDTFNFKNQVNFIDIKVLSITGLVENYMKRIDVGTSYPKYKWVALSSPVEYDSSLPYSKDNRNPFFENKTHHTLNYKLAAINFVSYDTTPTFEDDFEVVFQARDGVKESYSYEKDKFNINETNDKLISGGDSHIYANLVDKPYFTSEETYKDLENYIKKGNLIR